MESLKATAYRLKNVATGRLFDDSGWIIDDPQAEKPSLVRAEYAQKQFAPKDASYGIYRFADWLPVRRMLAGSCAPVTYRSEGLARALGLKNLYITFSGYFPEIGARMSTCSFKETEAYSVCGRLPEGNDRILVVASAGNTARAFAKVCSENKIPLLLSVPEDNLDALWFEQPLNDCVKLIAAQKGGDYFDAIRISNMVLSSPRFLAEGGAKNIARRDGMSTTVLSAVDHIGRIPDFYFQAVGSGTGAIAAWEANLRLIEDGRFGTHRMRLMVSQNTPFLPMYKAWQADSRALLPYDDDQARRDAETIQAKVLSNRQPPYGIAGGLYDALKDTRGGVLQVTNRELMAAQALFKETEGIDIYSAAGVAVSSLEASVKAGTVPADALVMLNITGGGEQRFKQDKKLWNLKPSVVFPLDVTPEKALADVNALFV